jgi:hypothetical protein
VIPFAVNAWTEAAEHNEPVDPPSFVLVASDADDPLPLSLVPLLAPSAESPPSPFPLPEPLPPLPPALSTEYEESHATAMSAPAIATADAAASVARTVAALPMIEAYKAERSRTSVQWKLESRVPRPASRVPLSGYPVFPQSR